MKKKIIFGMVLILILTVSVCSGLFLYYSYQAQNEEAVRYTTRELKMIRREFQKNNELMKSEDAYIKRQAVIYKMKSLNSLYGEDCIYVLQDGEEDIFNDSGFNVRYVLDTMGKNWQEEAGFFECNTALFAYDDRYYCIAGDEVSYKGDSYGISVVHDITESRRRLNRVVFYSVLINVLVIILGSVVAVTFLNKSFRLVEALKDTMNAFAGGDYGVRVLSDKTDEVGQLSNHFDRMADSISGQIEEQNMLFHALAHEMKTPVTAIVGYSFALKSGNINDAQRDEALSFIESESRRLERLSSKLSDLFLTDNGKKNFEPVRISELADSLKSIIAQKAEEKGVHIHFELPDDYETEGDKDLLCVLFTNLFDNACKAGAKNVAFQFFPDKWQVTDDGCGILPEEIEKITKPFYQGDKSRSKEGFGLGLAICERIANLHGMRLGIKSKGKGSSFYIYFTNS